MANASDKVLAIAKAELGYLEKKNGNNLYDKTANAGENNYTKYGYEMHQVYPAVMDYPAAWCDCFVDWCFYKAYGVANAKALLGGNFDDYTVNSAQLYKNKGAYFKTPMVGDQIFFNNGTRICHTGLVYAVDGSYVYTYEGNTSNASGVIANGGGVAAKKYSLSYNRIDGYGRPNYALVGGTSEVTTPPAQIPSAVGDEKTIWDFLISKGLNAFAVAGVMGNLNAESGLKTNNLENSYETKLKMTDVSYTAAVDNGSYNNFVKDAAGYGLAQWTYWSRKQKLYDMCKQRGVSISNLAVQLEYLWIELQGYKSVFNVLKVAKSVQEASDIVLTDFENPKRQDQGVKDKRAAYGMVYYNKYSGSAVTSAPSAVKPTVAPASAGLKEGSKGALVTALQHNLNFVMKCGIAADGDFGPKTKAALIAFQQKYGLKADGIYDAEDEAKMKAVINGSSSAPVVNKVVPACASGSPALKKGSKGAQVKLLQQDLNYVMNAGLKVDGDFGPASDKAVRDFQSKYGLAVDGSYGPASAAKMKTLLK